MSKDLPPGYDAYARLKFLHEVGYIAAEEKQAKQLQVADTNRRRAALASWKRRKGK